jgi:ligand-binding SRPBCC domain-containing protein
VLQFEKTSLIDAPVTSVWRFHERPDILQLLTPPWQPVQIVRREGGLGIGAISEFRLWLGPIPVQWIAKHIDCVVNHYFVDIQQSGPMSYWQHRHQFTAIGEQTQLQDTIEFAIPGGNSLEQWMGQWVQSRLSDMFDYRHTITRLHCEPQKH